MIRYEYKLLIRQEPIHNPLRLWGSVHSCIIHELMKSLFLPAKSLATSINQIHSN